MPVSSLDSYVFGSELPDSFLRLLEARMSQSTDRNDDDDSTQDDTPEMSDKPEKIIVNPVLPVDSGFDQTNSVRTKGPKKNLNQKF